MEKGYRDLIVYQRAYALAMKVFEVSKRFPSEERFGLTNQLRRSSRAVVANIAEGYRRASHIRSMPMRFEDADAEAGETQVWIDLAADCGYLARDVDEELRTGYEEIGRMLGRILIDPSRFRPNR